MKHRAISYLLTIAGLVAIALAWPNLGELGVVFADSPFKKPTATAFLSIGGFGFSPVRSYVPNKGYLWDPNGGHLMSTQQPEGFYAPVYLPHGAKVTKVEAWVTDNTRQQSPINLFFVGLPMKERTKREFVLANVHSMNVQGEGMLTQTINHVIDNENNCYGVQVLISPGNMLRAVRLTYIAP